MLLYFYYLFHIHNQFLDTFKSITSKSNYSMFCLLLVQETHITQFLQEILSAIEDFWQVA